MTELNMYKEALSLQLNWMCIKKLHHGDKWTGAYKNTTGSKLASNRLHLPMINGSNKIDTWKMIGIDCTGMQMLWLPFWSCQPIKAKWMCPITSRQLVASKVTYNVVRIGE